MPDLLINWPRDFSQHEDVEMQIYTDSGDEKTLRYMNGKIVRTLETNRIFDVALTNDTSSSAGSVINAVPNQTLRKRFLCGEIVECYLDQVGWSPGYILRQLPNAITVPEDNSESDPEPRSASGYDMFCCHKKGGTAKFQHEPIQSISVYKVVHGNQRGSRPQTKRVQSCHIRKLLGRSSVPLKKRSRVKLVKGDDVEVAMIEGVPSRKNSFRRAICIRVPGNFCNKTTNLSYGYIYIITYIYTYISSYVSLCPLRLTLTTYLNTAKRMFLCHHTYQVNLKIHLMYCIWMAP